MNIIDKVVKKMMSAADNAIYNVASEKLDEIDDAGDSCFGDFINNDDYSIKIKDNSYGVIGDNSFDTTNFITFTYGGGTTTVNLDASNKLNELEEEQLKEEKMRAKHETLQEAYEHYQLIKKLVEDTESDKYIENRYKDFE